MKMSKPNKAGKPYTVISQNEKMDTSGMANKPMEYKMMEFAMPKMPLCDMVRKVSEKRMK